MRTPKVSESHPRCFVLLILVAASLITACSDSDFVVDRRFDFFVNLASAEVTTEGRKIDPLSLLEPAPPWTDDERLFYPAPPRTTIRFKDVPLGKGAVLQVGMGLVPGSPDPDRFDQNGLLTFRIDLETDEQRFSLLDREIRVSELTGHSVDDIWIPLPDHFAGVGNFIFYSHKSPSLEALRSTWCGPLLISEGRTIGSEEASVSRETRLSNLLDHPLIETDTAQKSFRADFDERKKEFVHDPQGRLLIQTAPASSTYELVVPAGSTLRLGIASIGRTGKSLREVLFQVRDGDEIIFAESLPATGQASSRRISVPIPFKDDQPTRLTLETSCGARQSRDEGTVAIWINPEIRQTRRVPRQRGSEGKNILLMVVDALRADHLPVFGYARALTPNLDRFLEKSVTFENAWSQSSWTVPSTATLLTGQYSYTHGLYDVNHWFLVPGIATIAENFQEAGMTTTAFVANHLISADNNFTVGFENFFTVPWCTAAQLNRAFFNWLDGRDDERFFAYLHYMEPHMPYAAPGEGFNRFGSTPSVSAGPDRSEALMFQIVKALKKLGRPANRADDFDDQLDAAADELVDLYDSEIAYWDEQFGVLLNQLTMRGILDDTIIIVTSDHGEEFMEHGQMQHGQSLHRELLHVPLIIGNTTHSPSKRKDLAGLIDVAPTLLALAGLSGTIAEVEPHSNFGGINLFGTSRSDGFLFAETAHGIRHLGEGMIAEQGVFSNVLKGILTGDDGRLALYDLRQDRDELKDLSEERPEDAKRLKRLIDQWIDSCRETAPYNISIFDASAIKQLEAIGYLK